ncbi:MAG: hypothetical protein Q8Q35_00630 [Nanoarchaeota archaeon]|nr:hypothetical protein [Nanoarchaeota archaeon]
MGIIDSILSPPFLVNNIKLIALLLGTTLLVIFSNVVNKKIAYPLAAYIKNLTKNSINTYIGKTKRVKLISKIVSESSATLVFIGYCYFGAFILSDYVFAPIMTRMSSFITIVVIALFMLISFLVNGLIDQE